MSTLPRIHPTQESARLADLRRLGVLDSLEEQAYDDITRMAATVCGTPMALITLVDDRRQWFKSRIGVQQTETPREVSFCAHAMAQPDQPLVIEDTAKDERFVANPLVTGEPHIRFYAGAPLVTAAGQALGTVCVLDSRPRAISDHQLEQLQFMAQQVVVMLEARATQALEAASPPLSP
ncbi:GAF domain-containing protein [Variovorax ginsengisoli]|uniref:GAF domain-containing protein n=1 Tax=Variovorax ginsengisoli TaxID=363844 RepID=A0ABT9S4U9_9BURK|nr:GAF domain-containing protein [Variovorax ginsengisoli]MDP9898909.1 GAF domain-containing protein [Variovorax ginsengisoli]